MFLAEAASYCIDKEGHSLICRLSVVGDRLVIFDLRRMPVDDQVVRAFKDPKEATEFGAEGIAISLVPELTDYQVVERAVTRTGIDYWLADQLDDELKFSARLEISGTQSGGESERKKRLRGKLKQTIGPTTAGFRRSWSSSATWLPRWSRSHEHERQDRVENDGPPASSRRDGGL